ncbi:hypothetical protein BDV38DRAFT_110566 [Aspergillus pseudotamarii]|uniref:Uncharacterized protein n=1 Tax=Aspergillus pseudotamarii TaxID=132259 RepID=A0A5N6SS54_ASPPS|nr:uncharacterized protein BDV38DRAFT_110566 [Aspergillus pseudotamarii]KAE8136621.1 hypothetical protein BDV38DRAFT_110566 [Aspergillus pseudotamarii]
MSLKARSKLWPSLSYAAQQSRLLCVLMQGPRAFCKTTRAPGRPVHHTRPELLQQHGDAAWVLKDQARQILSGWPIEDAMFGC